MMQSALRTECSGCGVRYFTGKLTPKQQGWAECPRCGQCAEKWTNALIVELSAKPSEPVAQLLQATADRAEELGDTAFADALRSMTED